MATNPNRKPQIDRAQIVEEALRLLNETRLAGLTMRVLADRLGIRAASLYWHFPNKAALISALTEDLFLQSLDQTPSKPHWRDWMRAFGRAIWRVLLKYPDSAVLILAAEIDAEQFARTSARIRQALAALDLPVEELMPLQSGIQALMTGWVNFAHTRYVERIEELIDIETAAFRTLDAMIDGWNPTRVAH